MELLLYAKEGLLLEGNMERVKTMIESSVWFERDPVCSTHLQDYGCYRRKHPSIRRYHLPESVVYDAPTEPLVTRAEYTCVAVLMMCGAMDGGRGISSRRAREVMESEKIFEENTVDSKLLYLSVVTGDDCPQLNPNRTIRFYGRRDLGYFGILTKYRGVLSFFREVNTCKRVVLRLGDHDVNMRWWREGLPKLPLVGDPFYWARGASSGGYGIGMLIFNKASVEYLLRSDTIWYEYEGPDDIMIGFELNLNANLLSIDVHDYVYGFGDCLNATACPSWIVNHGKKDDFDPSCVNHKPVCKAREGWEPIISRKNVAKYY